MNAEIVPLSGRVAFTIDCRDYSESLNAFEEERLKLSRFVRKCSNHQYATLSTFWPFRIQTTTLYHTSRETANTPLKSRALVGFNDPESYKKIVADVKDFTT